MSNRIQNAPGSERGRPDPIVYPLTETDLAFIRDQGTKRHLSHLGYRDRPTYLPDREEIDFLGMVGEFVVANWLGYSKASYQEGVLGDRYGDIDVGQYVLQVKTARVKNRLYLLSGDYLITPEALAHIKGDIIVAVRYIEPTAYIMGWLWPHEIPALGTLRNTIGRKGEAEGQVRMSWCVPVGLLHKIHGLELLKARRAA